VGNLTLSLLSITFFFSYSDFKPSDFYLFTDKSSRPVCRHFSKKGHCRYEDLCAFYHPGVNGPPLWDCAFPSRLEGALCDLVAMYFPLALWRLLWGSSTYHPQSVTYPSPSTTSTIWGPELCFITGAQCVLSSDPGSRDSPSGSHLNPFSCLLDLLPLHKWLLNRKPLVLFLVHLSTCHPVLPSIPESPGVVSYPLAACFKSFFNVAP
jgi:hypothetical protein